jgi:hypothetical protein
MSDSNEVVTDPRLEKRTRRRFSVAEKKGSIALLVGSGSRQRPDFRGI